LPAGSLAAVVSFYAIIHLPVEEQPALFAHIYRWLRPGGYLLATVGHRAWTGTEEEWLGAKCIGATRTRPPTGSGLPHRDIRCNGLTSSPKGMAATRCYWPKNRNRTG
jgi:hypothetical protein